MIALPARREQRFLHAFIAAAQPGMSPSFEREQRDLIAFLHE